MSKINPIKGKSTPDLLSISLREFMGLSKPQLRAVVSRLSDTANKRIKALQSRQLPSMALYSVQDSGGKFSTRGKDMDALQAEYMRVKDFLVQPTSTVTGARAAIAETEKALRDVYGEDIPDDIDIQKLIDDYYRLQNEDQGFIAQKLRYGHLYDGDANVVSDDEKSRVIDLSNRIAELLNHSFTPGGMNYDGVSRWFDIMQ